MTYLLQYARRPDSIAPRTTLLGSLRRFHDGLAVEAELAARRGH